MEKDPGGAGMTVPCCEHCWHTTPMTHSTPCWQCDNPGGVGE